MHFCASRQVYLLGLFHNSALFPDHWPRLVLRTDKFAWFFGSLIFQSDCLLPRHMQQPIKGVFLFPGKAEIYVAKTYF